MDALSWKRATQPHVGVPRKSRGVRLVCVALAAGCSATLPERGMLRPEREQRSTRWQQDPSFLLPGERPGSGDKQILEKTQQRGSAQRACVPESIPCKTSPLEAGKQTSKSELQR